MARVVAYGICVKNSELTSESIKRTVGYQETAALNCFEQVVEVVRADNKKRPKLQELIDSLEAGDRIEMYSIETLLAGDTTSSCKLYNQIIDKGIDIIIYDFQNCYPRITEFSTLRYGKKDLGEEEYEPSKQSKAQLKQCFADRVLQAKPNKRTGYNRSLERIENIQVFKELYFAFESYQLALADTLELLKRYMGFQNKITFYAMCRDYESSLDYINDFNEYASHTPEILELPKRCNENQDFYNLILEYAQNHKSENGWVASVNNAFCDLGYKCDYNIFHRYELLTDRTPKPRKPVVLDFNEEVFCEKYRR